MAFAKPVPASEAGYSRAGLVSRVAVVALLLLALVAPPQVCAAEGLEEDPADALMTRIWGLRTEGNYAEAVEVALELVAMRKGDPEAKPFEIADAEGLVETLQHMAGLPDEAKRELAVADSLTDVLASLWDDASYAEGVEAAQRQLDIRREHLGNVNLDVSESLNELALFLSAMSEYEAAEPYLREALAIDRAILGGEHPVVATSLNSVGMLLHYIGHTAEAELLLREALTSHLELLGEEHAEVANTMSNLAVALSGQGRFGEAGHLSRKALAIRRKVFPEGHPDIELSLHNLGSTLQNQGDYGRAEALFREALAISRSLRGDRHPDVAHVKNSLAIVLRYQGMYDEADLLLREALDTLTESLGEDSPHIPLVANNLADVLALRGYPDEAVALLRSELERQIGGGAHDDPRLARTMSNLSVMLGRYGKFVEAEQLARRALEIRRKSLGKANPDLVRSLHNLGALEWRLGKPAAAESLLVLAAREFEVARLRAGEGLARSMLLGASPYIFLAHARLEMGREAEAWESAERAVARSLADMLVAANERQLTETESTQEDSLVALIRRLEDEVRTCGTAMQADSTGVLAQRYRASRSRLVDVEVVWSDFRQAIAAKYPLSEGEVFSLERIGRSLPEETAIVGWIDLWRGGSEFVAWGYVLRSPGVVVWKRLGQLVSEGDLSPSGRVRKLCSELATPASTQLGLDIESRAIWSERFEPLSDALEGVDELVVIPSRVMLGLPVEMLTDDTATPLAKRYRVSYAPSATVYAWLMERSGGPREDSPPRALLVGDPPYNREQLAAMERGQTSRDVALVEAGWTPGSEALRSALAGNEQALSSLPRLTGTRAEVLSVSEVCRGAKVLLGDAASEEELVRFNRLGQLAEFDVLHIATHALVDNTQPELSALVLSQVDLPDPLEAIVSGDRIYDGLITAEEIVREWNLSADLVVLSACDTGLGREVAGEGYVGFAHAFLQAGARSLLLSMWKVDDTATAMLMRRFYENWLRGPDGGDQGARGMPKAEALRQAKLWLRDYTDEYGSRPYEHPYFWSAFILVGDGG